MKYKILLKKIIKKNQKLYKFLSLLHFLCLTQWRIVDGSKRKYPKVLQLPITYKCNSHCVMCNVWKMDSSKEMTVKEFSNFIKDPIFKKIESVGINGGEPSLIHDLPNYVDEILNLPNLKSINIISNGLSKTSLLKNLKEIYIACKKKDINFHVSISLDGIGKIHDVIRGIPNAFNKTISTINEIIKYQNKYSDSIDIGCTVVKQNVCHLTELDVFANKNGYKIKYRLGIGNKRIESDEIIDKFSIMYEPTLKQTAKEFFHSCLFKANNWNDKYKYFSIFYFLNSKNTKNTKRLLGCSWKDRDITMDPRGNLYYCAVASKKIGSLRKNNGEKIFFDKNNIEYRKNIVENCCNKCIHDYSGKIEFKNALFFLNYLLYERFCFKIYRIKGIFL